jgi:hypothetical protein
MKVMQAHFTNEGSRSVNSEPTVMTAERMNAIFSAIRERSRHDAAPGRTGSGWLQRKHVVSSLRIVPLQLGHLTM